MFFSSYVPDPNFKRFFYKNYKMAKNFDNSLNGKIIDFLDANGAIDENKFLEIQSKHEYISLHAPIKNVKKRYIEISAFNQLLTEIIKENYRQNQLTYQYGNFMMNDVFNYLYIDFDYWVINDNFEQENINLARFVEGLIREKFGPRYIMTFVPNVLTNKGGMHKCGFHINVYLADVITYENRCNMATELKDALLTHSTIASWWGKYQDIVYASDNDQQTCKLLDIFDENRFKSTSSHILPFCQKNSAARQYKLISGYGFNNGNYDYIVGSTAEMYNLCSKKPNGRITRMSINTKNYSIEMMRNIGQSMIDNHEVNCTKLDDIDPHDITIKRREITRRKLLELHQLDSDCSGDLIQVEMFLYDFIDGISTMCDNLPIIEAFKKGAEYGRMNQYIIKIVQFWFMLYSLANKITKLEIKDPETMDPDELERRLKLAKIGSYDHELDQKAPSIIKCLLMPLFIRGGKTDDIGIDSIIYNTIKFMAPKHTKNANPTDPNYDVNIDFRSDEDDFFKSLYTPNEIYNFHQYASIPPKSRESLSKKDPYRYAELEHDHRKLLYKFKTKLNSWFEFVKNEIFEKITYEIEPFQPYTRSRDNFSFVDMNLRPMFYKEYNYQLSNLNKMFLFVLVGNTSANQYETTVHKIIARYVKNYVYITKKNGSLKAEDKEVYIYNIRQTNLLCAMPYNQWILDNNSVLKNWITIIYDKMIRPLEETTSGSSIGGIQAICKIIFERFRMLEFEKRGGGTGIVEKMKIGGGKSTINNAYDHIVAYDSNTDQYLTSTPPVIDVPQKSSYMPARNGLIHYVFDQTTRTWRASFEKNNRHIILNTYTLATYVPLEEYDWNNPVYKHLMEVLTQIYPDKEEREWILNMYATVVCPMIVKDQMLFLYGTGSDGKSTMNKIVENFLGHQDATNILVTEDGDPQHQISLFNPFGYATTFKSSTLTVSENGSNHNEGGVINFDRKTFAVAQEPPQRKIHTEVFKDFLSGSVTVARKIRQATKQFVCNLLVVVETNQIPQFDIVDNAVRRRVAIYAHQSKFRMHSTQTYVNKKYVYKAEPDIIDRINKDTRYWQALLEEFVRRCVKLLNTDVIIDGQRTHGIKQISDIQMPKSVMKSTESAFGRTNGLTKWLDTVLLDIGRGFIPIYDLVRFIKKRNSTAKRIGDGSKGFILDARRSEEEVMKEIKMVIQNKFEDQLFKLNIDNVKKEGGKTSRTEIDMIKVRMLSKNTKSLTIEELRQHNIIEEYALTTIDSAPDPNLKDVVLVAFDYNDDDEDIRELLESEIEDENDAQTPFEL